MSRTVELYALLIADALMLGAAWFGFDQLAAAQGWFVSPGWISPVLFCAIFVTGWMVLYAFAGLYEQRYADSRFDELVSLAKVTAFGALAILFVFFLDRLEPGAVQGSILTLGGMVFGAVAFSRVVVRTIQKYLVVRGYVRHRAVVVGWSDRVEALYHDLETYPAAGIELAGAVRLLHHPEPLAVLVPAGHARGDGGGMASGDALPDGAVEVTAAGAPEAAIAELPRLIDQFGVHDVLIALGSDDHAYLDEVLRVCEGRTVALKLVPDFYAAVGGMARTEHTYGLPLIELLPEPIPTWERRTKRIVDVIVSAFVLMAGLPIWLVIGALVRATSPGPAIYRQTRVARYGRPFTMYKYRTMVDGAERDTGPVWADKADARVTPLGRGLRRLRIDEIPQMWNVLRGDMSLVGPRPERPYFVDKLGDRIPLYSRRHRVQPGVTGLAQVKWRYDASIEDVRQKLKYDLFYIENMSLRLDAKILLQTIRTALSGGGR
ncbi:MAG: sugar transferase [Bacteroidota bacterium]